MKVFSALVWHEIFERRLLLLASAVLGFVPVVIPWLPVAADHVAPDDIRIAVAVAIVLLFGGATLLILGGTIVGRDLSEGRLGFFLSRPISPWSLWLSRLAAAAALVVASVLLMAAPTVLLELDRLAEALTELPTARAVPLLALGQMQIYPGVWQSLPRAPSLAGLLVAALLATFALLALVHAASTIVRSRNVWVLADLGGLGTFVALVWTARDVLLREQAMGAMVWAERWGFLWILGSLLFAGGVQIARGRTDLARSHRWLSATLWSCLIAGALLFGGYARFVASSDVDDLERLVYAEPSPNHDWLLADGTTRHRAGARATFLLDNTGERSWRLGKLDVLPAFSADGGTLAIARCDPRPPTCRVWTLDLHAADSPPRATEIAFEGFPHEVAISDDGTHLAFSRSGGVIVYDISSARLLAAVEAERPYSLRFLNRDRLEFHQAVGLDGTRRLEVRQLDVPNRRAVTVETLTHRAAAERSARDDALIYRTLRGSYGLFGGDTRQALLRRAYMLQRLTEGFTLADGRRIASRSDGYDLTLRVLSPDGEELRRLERSGAKAVLFGGELAEGRVLLTLSEDPWEPAPEVRAALSVEPIEGWTTYLLDAETAELTPLAAGVAPFATPRAAPGPRFFLAGGDAVIHWDPSTGEHHTVLPALRRR